ncbi:Uncharacterised protein [uncultured archaeon]|nr:Uncharacterised protein [uncultured archaeon]
MKNTIIDGLEIAPECCIVCEKPMPDEPDSAGWFYIIGVKPIGAIVCSQECFDKVKERHEKTGRIDTPKQRHSDA